MKKIFIIFLFTCFASIFPCGAMEKLVIIGGGPAGLTAAIFAGQFNFHPLVIEGESQGMVVGVTIKDNKTNAESHQPCEGVFVSIGRRPNTHLFKSQLEMTKEGFIVTQPDSTLTSIPGVFAAGDIADHSYRKMVTAAASGCASAMDANRYLKSPDDK